MIFERFLKPKWQHRNPDIRRAAIEELNDPEILHELAKNDEDRQVRKTAVRKIEDLTVLNHIAQEDADVQLRDLAHQRVKQLLAGQKNSQLPLADRMQWIGQLTDIALLEYLAVSANEPDLRLLAISKIQRESLLGDISINDPVSKVRQTTAERLTERSTLQRVFNAMRTRDKRVTQIVREKLDVLNEAAERPQKIQTECETIIARLGTLLHNKLWDLAQAELPRLHERWQLIEKEVKPEFITRYQEIEQTLQTAVAQHREEIEKLLRQEKDLAPFRSTKLKYCEQVENLLAELEETTEILTEAQYQQHDLHLTGWQQGWENTTNLPNTEEENTWQQRFTRAHQSARQRLQTLHTYQQLQQTLTTLLHKAEGLLQNKSFLNQKQIKELQTNWEALSLPKSQPETIHKLNQKLNDLFKSLQEKIDNQKEEQSAVIQKLKQLLKDLETVLDKGELHTALPLEQQVRDLSTQLGNKAKPFEKQIHDCSTKVKELQSWQRWGAIRERENLCTQIESLIDRPEDDLEETARLIREAQESWKKLGSSGHSQELWERFNKACNTAYAPCRVYFETKAEERQQNLTKKDTLCAKLEQYPAQIDWKNPNWKDIYHFVRDVEKEWHNIGPTDAKYRKPLKRRYEEAMKILARHLEEEYKRNSEQRKRLIQRVKETHAMEDIEKAINEVKGLQSKWQVTVPGNRKEERDLWKEFRDACDVVFNRRRQKSEAFKNELDIHLNQKKAVCEQVEALANLEGDALKQALGQLKKYQHEFDAIGDVPKSQVTNIEKRFSNALRKVEHRHHAQLGNEQRAELERLKTKAALCIRLEQMELPVSQEEIAEIQQQWSELEPLAKSAWESSIQQRFATACVAPGEISESEKIFADRSLLCVRMEILAGVDSPPEAMAERLSYQVARLNQAMTGGVKTPDKLTEAREIERLWYLTPAIPKAQIISLEQRFQQALSAFYHAQRHPHPSGSSKNESE